MRTVEAAVLYFALMFAAGFVGTVRTQWVAPHVGARKAELIEAPIMLVISIVIAGWIVMRLAVSPTPSARLAMGGIALVLMLVAEFGFVLRLRGLTIRDYFASRDPVAATVYYLALAIFAAIPLLVR
jgi:hypothetical protein